MDSILSSNLFLAYKKNKLFDLKNLILMYVHKNFNNGFPAITIHKWKFFVLWKSSINILCLKMCSLRGGDFRNWFSVFGLYVMPTHG